LEGFKNSSLDNFNDLDFNSWNIGSRSSEEPFISGISLSTIKFNISSCSETKSSVGEYDLKWGNLAIKGFSRIEREWVTLSANFLISMSNLDLTIDIGNRFSVFNYGWVLDDAIVSRRDHNHLIRP
jgi:hypothetical protein